MKSKISFLILIIFIIGCGDRNYGSKPGDNTDPGPYSIESEPSLSPKRDYIYYISTDSNFFRFGGIYRVSVATPLREKLLHGSGYHSPTLSFDNHTIAYLESGRVKYFNMSTLELSESPLTETFKSILYIDTNKLLAHWSDPLNRNDSIYIINDSNPIFALSSGWDPTFIEREEFVYFDGSDTDYYIIKNNARFAGAPDTIFKVVTANAKPRWPSYDPMTGRLTYSIYSNNGYLIYSAEAGKRDSIFIDVSIRPKPLILNFNLIIFTGADGRFYQSDYFGVKSVPFTYVKDPI